MRRLAFLLLLTACQRPVANRELGRTLLDDLTVTPAFVRAGVPISLELQILGPPPSALRYEIGGLGFDCQPERVGEGRYACRHPGLARDTLPEGTVAVLVTLTDSDGNRSSVASALTLDFQCPAVTSLSVAPEIAQPGDTVTVSIEASEPLGQAPLVTRAGRAWEVPQGDAQRFSLQHPITAADPAAFEDIVVQLTDRAGNSTVDCANPGRRRFAVDQTPPNIDPSKVSVFRDAAGSNATVRAQPGAFVDDVAVAELLVREAQSERVLLRVVPQADGALPATNLGAQTERVVLRLTDLLGRTSEWTSVPEEWRVSVGQGATPQSAVRTGNRATAPAPDSPFLDNRTAELAPALAAQDARVATVRARVGFEPAGRLPNAYEDVIWMPSGYDKSGHALVTFGGVRFANEENQFDTFFEDTLILRWNEFSRAYEFEYGEPYRRGLSPTGRATHSLPFDANGCALLFGGQGLEEREDASGPFLRQSYLSDSWQICRSGVTYRWTKLSPQGTLPVIRRTPVAFDPSANRYLIPNGYSAAGGLFPFEDVFLLQPGATPADWRWIEMSPLPTSFGERHSHLTYWDPVARGMVVALGYVRPFSNERDMWLYKNGQWQVTSQLPAALGGRQGFGYAYDEARRQLVLWGDNEFPNFDTQTWFMTGTATAPTWKSQNLDPPVPRAWPVLVYDPDREVTLVYAGQRFDDRFVPPDIYAIVSEPAWPHLLARVDLGAAPPRGINRLKLSVRAAGSGDDDGPGGAATTRGGYRVQLWDHQARAWEQVAAVEHPLDAEPQPTEILVTQNPERFVGPTGVIPVVIVSTAPATLDIPARLDVDLLDGALELRSGLSLP